MFSTCCVLPSSFTFFVSWVLLSFPDFLSRTWSTPRKATNWIIQFWITDKEFCMILSFCIRGIHTFLDRLNQRLVETISDSHRFHWGFNAHGSLWKPWTTVVSQRLPAQRRRVWVPNAHDHWRPEGLRLKNCPLQDVVGDWMKQGTKRAEQCVDVFTFMMLQGTGLWDFMGNFRLKIVPKKQFVSTGIARSNPDELPLVQNESEIGWCRSGSFDRASVRAIFLYHFLYGRPSTFKWANHFTNGQVTSIKVCFLREMCLVKSCQLSNCCQHFKRLHPTRHGQIKSAKMARCFLGRPVWLFSAMSLSLQTYQVNFVWDHLGTYFKIVTPVLKSRLLLFASYISIHNLHHLHVSTAFNC